MKKVVISFDDGRADNTRVVDEIFVPIGMPATFNITTGFIEKKIDLHSKIGPMSVMDVKKIYQKGIFEIACHSEKHTNELGDMLKGRETLVDWLDLQEDYKIGFASPGSEMQMDEIVRKKRELFEAGFAYVRTGPMIKNFLHFRLLCRKLTRYIHIASMYAFAYNGCIQKSMDDWMLLSVPILHGIRPEQIIRLIDTMGDDERIVLMFHSVMKRGEMGYDDNWSLDYDTFLKLIDWLENERYLGRIEVVNTRQLLSM